MENKEDLKEAKEKRMKIAIMRLFDLCSRLDKEPYKCSIDEKYGELFDRELRYYLFDLNVPLTYYNKRLEQFGLRKEWKENLLFLDTINGERYQDRLREKIEQHEKVMEELLVKKKQKQKEERAKLQSHFGKTDTRKVENVKKLLQEVVFMFRYPWRGSQYKCGICELETDASFIKYRKMQICRHCVKEFLNNEKMSWYHDHVKYKAEELKNDLHRAIRNKKIAEEVKTKVNEVQGEANAMEMVEENKYDSYSFQKEGNTVTYFRLKGVQFEEREKVIEKVRSYYKEKNEFPPILLEREPNNIHDKDAVAVYVRLPDADYMAGYVPKSLSEEISTIIKGGFKLDPRIISYFVFEYTYRWYDEEYMEWEEEYTSFWTLCIGITETPEAAAHAFDVIGLPF